LAHDRFGVRWGLAGGTTLATVKEVREAARFADASGFDGLWVSHAMAVDPIVALACVGAEAPNLKEFGTSVVPLYGRHSIGLAQQAMTAHRTWGALYARHRRCVQTAGRGSHGARLGSAVFVYARFR
jgi:alkanesulfonate monooxygenase SsuD/methylene tetrahydromethanopterin reductase-like flavin-dependent oxidoreductase (luciferase family)